jgi:hypothetical protein
MGSLKPREERRKTFLRARLRTDLGWSDVTIANVSSRGLMLQSVAPLDRNCFVEVRHGNACIVGRIVWTHGASCGLRTQDSIDVSRMLSQAPPKPRKPGEERRATPRGRELWGPVFSPDERLAASRRFARVFDWMLMLLAATAAGGFMAQSAWAALAAPMAQVNGALAEAN